MTSIQEQLEAAKGQMRALWQAGDYEGYVRTFHTSAADDLAASLSAPEGGAALDAACGTGASSIPLARRGLTVTGIDMSPHLLAVARRKAAEQGLAIRFDEGFLEQMPYADARFDVVVSMFGVMFSPMPEAVVDEIARVTKPGGKLALTNWTSGGFSGRMNEVLAPYLPPMPPDTPSPFAWGDAQKARHWLGPHFRNIETGIVPITWAVDASPAEAARRFLDTAAPLQFVMGFLSEERKLAFTHEFETYWEKNNRSSSRDRTLIENECLRISADRA